jgi:hypothetical protein
VASLVSLANLDGSINVCMYVHAAIRDIKFSSEYVRVPSGIRDSEK